MTDLDHEIEIIEVSPRDGLQNEKTAVSTSEKRQLVYSLVAAGVRRLEVTSFVHPDRVPQMADAEALMASLRRDREVTLIGLVLNQRGAQRAVAAGVDELNYVVPLTDTFGSKNQGVTFAESLEALPSIGRLARAEGKSWSVTLAVAFGCPYEGEVSVERVVGAASRVLQTAPDELALADTIGSGVPADVHERIPAVQALSDTPLRAHFHDTRHTALANSLAALDEGVRRLDASAAGLGGCPFAPGAAGNVATEDLAWMLARSGWHTAIDVDGIVTAGLRVCAGLGIEARSGVARAGYFPPILPGDRSR